MPFIFFSLWRSFFLIPLLSSLLIASKAQQSQTHFDKMCSGKSNSSIFGKFQDNLSTFLQASVYYYDIGTSGYYSATVGEGVDRVYGLLLCGSDVAPDECRSCGQEATREILDQCPYSRGAIIWYNDCMLRYSNDSFFSVAESSPFICSMKVLRETEPRNLNAALDDAFQSLAYQAASSSSLYATILVNVSRLVGLYGRAECTRDLSKENCSDCLQNVVTYIPECRRQGEPAGVLAPSCSIRYELHQLGPEVESPAPSKPKETIDRHINRGRKRKMSAVMIGVHIVSAVLVMAISICCVYSMWRKKAKSKVQRKGHDYWEGSRLGDDYSSEFMDEVNQMKIEFPSIQLDLLHAATRHFSAENKLGEGGFGPVYKGTLVGGVEIAVKRLSRRSSQGLEEFKNEVSLMAKLQHRNLVRLYGCCIDASELLLVYEYLPNKSLDLFIFDSSSRTMLDWKQRFSIIIGIARGLLYLHEDSRLTIIHRDLKASNVLLDHELNPKISDFGVARILCGSQNEASTDIVVGTLGYMAPEYATEGLFSIKSDVFSFGVLVLEIISGKKNGRSHFSEPSLLTLAWKLWSDERGLEMLDPVLEQSFVAAEVLKCLHIALLCVQEDPAKRPNMLFVVALLGTNSSSPLPCPTQPDISFEMGF